jgi:AcrR family transcriptional regulator
MFRQVTVTNSIVQQAGDDGKSGDGRRARWVRHRAERRVELLGAAIEVIVQSGGDADMDQIAAYAGVSKPVLYRYFADKAELFTAVGDHVARLILDAVSPAIARVREERDLVAATIDAYLSAIEGQPELYRFVMGNAGLPAMHQLIARSSRTIAAGLARVIGDRLRAVGLDAGPAEPWAYGMVGMVQAVGDWWMDHGQPMSREALTDYLTTLLWRGIEGVRASADVPGGLGAINA